MKISKAYFYSILLMIVLLPALVYTDLILFGERTTGIVTDNMHRNVISRAGTADYFSVIEFKANDYVVLMPAPQNMTYPIGKRLPIIYRSSDPKDCIVNSVSAWYAGNYTGIAIMMLMVWVAMYLAFRVKS